MKVVGFLKEDTYISTNKEKDKNFLYSLTDVQINELSLEISNSCIYDSEKEWFNDLNEGYIDTERYYWFIIPNF